MTAYEFQVYVRAEAPAPDFAAWRAELKRSGLPVELSAVIDLATHRGAVPCRYAGLAARVHLTRRAYDDSLLPPDAPVGSVRADTALRFGYHGETRDVIAALTLAAAAAKLWGGTVHATASELLLTPDAALDQARDMAVTHGGPA